MNKLLALNNRSDLLRCCYARNHIFRTTQLQWQSSQKLAAKEQQPLASSQNQSRIHSKQSCIEEFKKLSDEFYVELKKASGRTLDFEERYSNLRMGMSRECVRVQNKHACSPSTLSVLGYVSENLEQFGVKEKALMFKIFSMMQQQHQSDSQVARVLAKLENDFYHIDLQSPNSAFSFLDYINYRDGFFYYRRNPPFHFLSQALDVACQQLLTSLDKDSKESLIPASETSNDLSQSIEAINNRWLLSYYNNEPLLLINYFLRDSAILTRDMRALLFTRLIHSSYKSFNEPAAARNSDALVALLSLYHRTKSHLIVNNETRELYLQLFHNNSRSLFIDEFAKLRNNNSRALFVQMLTVLIRTHSEADKAHFYSSLVSHLYKELMSAKHPDEFTMAIKCLGELFYHPKRNQKNLKTSTFHIYEPLFSRLSEGYLNDYKEPIELKNRRKDSSSSGEKPEQSEPTNVRYLSRQDERIVQQRFEEIFRNSELMHLIDFIHSTRLEQFKWLGRPLTIVFVKSFENLLQHLGDFPNGGNELIEQCFNSAIKLKTHFRDVFFSRPILDVFYSRYVKNPTVSSERKCQAIGLLLAHPQYVEAKFDELAQTMHNLIEQSPLYIGPFIRELCSNEVYMDTLRKPTSDIIYKLYDDLSKRAMNYNYPSQTQDEMYFKVNSDNIVQLFKVRTKLRFDSTELSLQRVLENMENFLKPLLQKPLPLNENDRLQLEIGITNYARCFQVMSSLFLLSNVYNHDLANQFLAGSIRALNVIESAKLFTNTNTRRGAAVSEQSRETTKQPNRATSHQERVILDFLTVFGIFDLFDVHCLKKSAVNKAELIQSLGRLKKLNETMYGHLKFDNLSSDSGNLLNLVLFNNTLLNMDIQFNQAINDMFTNIGSVQNLVKKFDYLNEPRLELLTKFVYIINQTLCAKHKDSNLMWLFKGYNPNLPFINAYRDVQNILLNIVDNRNNLRRFPKYEYGFVANFEIDANTLLDNKQEKSKINKIPILVFDKSYYYENSDDLKMPIALYVRNFKKLYPLVIINSDKMTRMQQNEKLDYVRKHLIKGLREFINN